jgi:GNAT superfamily N-acetyltransferase
MSTVPYSISIYDQPGPHDVCIIEAGLTAFNLLHAPPENYQPLLVVVRAADNRVVGGAVGNTWWGWLRIDALWVDEAVRYQGLGTRLMRAAEEEALRRECHHVFLDTLSFQALPFYLQLGYEVFGQLDDLPVGHSRYFLQKSLWASGATRHE